MLIYSFITDYQVFNLQYKDNTARDKNETKVGKQSANLGKNNEPIQNRLSFLIDCKSVILHHLTILSFPMVRPAWDNWWLLVVFWSLRLWVGIQDNTLQTAASQPHGGIALYKDTVLNTLSSTKKTNSSEISKRNGKSFNVDVSFCWNSSWKSDFWKENMPFCSNCHDSFWRKSRNHTLFCIFFPKNCARTQKGIIFALEKIE